MINQISANKTEFQTVDFHSGFNVILADRVSDSDKDSRNGAGKSSLIDIIHFCLGSYPSPNQGLRVEELQDWTFTMNITLNGNDFLIKRNTKRLSFVIIEGDFSDWPIKPTYDSNIDSYTMKVKDWNSLLRNQMFDLPVDFQELKYTPTFRSLISYFIRRGASAFQYPFKHYPQQKEWDIQVNNAYLLGLNFEYPSKLQSLKDQQDALNKLKKAANEGLLTEYFGTMGELEAERVRLEEIISNTSERLKTFKVHPDYYEIQKEANEITSEIQKLLNKININQQLLDKYKNNLESESDVSVNFIEQIYNEAGVHFPDRLVKDISDVKNFHSEIIKNRKEYLNTEIRKLSDAVDQDRKSVEKLTNKRAILLQILDSHGALDEHHKLSEWHSENLKAYNEILSRIENFNKFEEGKSQLKVEKEDIISMMREDYSERKGLISNAIRIFNQNSQTLYNEPGTLSINIKEKGYDFDIDIKRSRSQGIGYMKTFCYDLTLAMLWSNNRKSPGVLIHDSTIFDGVDERQIAKAIELAYNMSKQKDFQYICTMNSDVVPYDEFTDGFDKNFNSSIVSTFSDATEDGGLFGIRF